MRAPRDFDAEAVLPSHLGSLLAGPLPPVDADT